MLDISKKAQRNNCEDILLSRHEKGGKCTRVLYPDQGPFNDTVYYDIYGPTIIASNEPLHHIMETRCLPINMPNLPGNYDNPRPEKGQELKERLTAWRARNLNIQLTDIKPIEGLSGRLWDITKPLFLVNGLLRVTHRILQDAILAIDRERNDSRKDTIEGRLVTIIKEITDEGDLHRFIEWSIKTNDILNNYNRNRPEDKQVSSQWIGKKLKSMSFHNRKINGYSEIKITQNEYETILKQYGFTCRESKNKTNTPNNSLPEKNEQEQTLLRVVESGRESVHEQANIDYQSPVEREIYEETMSELQRKEGMAQQEIEREAYKQLIESRKHLETITEFEFPGK